MSKPTTVTRDDRATRLALLLLRKPAQPAKEAMAKALCLADSRIVVVL